MADNIGGEGLSPWTWALIGSIAGTAARANDWVDAHGKIAWKLFFADLSASGVIVIIAVLTSDWLRLPGPYSAGFASILTLVGLRVLRATAIQMVDIGVRAVSKRAGVDADPPAASPEDKSSEPKG